MIEEILVFAAIGFAAQLVDGALGMAYGLIASSVLIGLGTPPAVASASVHAAEVFTTGASGLSHWRLGNVDWRLVRRLAVPGMIGAAIGAYVLVSIPDDIVRPLVNAYLIIIGLVLVVRAIRNRPPREVEPRFVPALGFVGGLLDASGGGGWGPVVSSNLIGGGAPPRFAIGSVNLTEFGVTVAATTVFFSTIGLDLWPIILGLVGGGILAAPLGAILVRRTPTRLLMALVGALVAGLSLNGLYTALTG